MGRSERSDRAKPRRRLESHSSHVKSVYEILGAYFVDVAYNHLYLRAKQGAQGRSVTDEYRACLAAYATGVVNDDDLYLRTVEGVIYRFQTSTRFGSIGSGEFIDHVIKASVPAEIYTNLQESDRRGFLAVVLKKAATEIVEIAGRPKMLAGIIDDHMNGNNVFAMQDEMISSLLGVRDDLFHKFLERFTGKKKRGAEADLVRGLRAELREIGLERDKYREALKHVRRQIAESERAAAADRERADRSVNLVRILMGRLQAVGRGTGSIPVPAPAPASAPASAPIAPIAPIRPESSTDGGDMSAETSDLAGESDGESAGESDEAAGEAADGLFNEDPFADGSEESAFASDSGSGLLDAVDSA